MALFGPEAACYETIEIKTWNGEKEEGGGGGGGGGIFGVRAEQRGRHYNYGGLKGRTLPGLERVIFAGTESEAEHGHMEGAVKSGQRAARDLRKLG